MSARHRSTAHHRRAVVSLIAVLAGCAAVVGLQFPGAYGGYIAKVTNGNDTAQAAPYFTCAAAQASDATTSDYLTYPFGESAGLSATDISGNNRTGAYSSLLNLGVTSTGVTYGQANTGTGAVCPRDKRTTIKLDGLTGFVSGPNTAVTGPNTFAVEIWFRTTVAQGKLIGFGSSRNTLSGSYDRQLYIDTNGKLVFAVYPNDYRTLTSTATVTDGAWHQAVGTLSSAGMALYLDGKQVAVDANTTTAQSFSGYWRIGWDNLATWPNAGANYYFNGSLAFASVYTDSLSPAQVAQHYAAGR